MSQHAGTRSFPDEFESVVVIGVSSMRSVAIAPSLVPSETVYIVLDDFGKLGRAYRETDENEPKMWSFRTNGSCDPDICNFVPRPMSLVGQFLVRQTWRRASTAGREESQQ